ncbi:MAG: N-acetylmuramoyl-L-alanine amidase [Lachnospiraceae bacterium]|nr:N-acetylmuramoyl-L-alanine amidase [Lachnospiraceae bacterium]
MRYCKSSIISDILNFTWCVAATAVIFCLCYVHPMGCGIAYAEEDAGNTDFVSDEQAVFSSSETEQLVIVIDPGHGGENLGGEYEDYTEKEMTIVVAKAMKEELEKYEGITVYLTRNGDQDLDLEERCEFAESVGADFLFCLHFNLSEYHTLFGAECWVSAFGENYSKGYSFASVEIDMLQELGLYSRGIKTRLNNRGTDYYGIIRHATERDIPCVLIEHCHLDQENDKPFYDHDEKLKDFGRLDATAVAKYFQLRSDELGVDYGDYPNVYVNVPSHVVAPDRTEPDICMIEVTDQNIENGEVTVQVSAADYDSGMLYYTYSYDNGEHFSELQRWPDKSRDTFSFTMRVPPRILPQIVVKGYNGYDLYTTSNMISLPSMDYKTEEEIAAQLAMQNALESASKAIASGKKDHVKDHVTISVTRQTPEKEEEKPVSFTYFLTVCIVCALLVLAMTISMILILRGAKRKRRRRRRRPKR